MFLTLNMFFWDLDLPSIVQRCNVLKILIIPPPPPQELERLARVHGLPVSPGEGGWSPHTDDSGVDSAAEPAPEPAHAPPPASTPTAAPVSINNHDIVLQTASSCYIIIKIIKS